MTPFGWVLFLDLVSQVDLPGTQPSELAFPPEPSSACNCHISFTSAATEPGESYRATVMSISARDPLFRAALKVANDDRPDTSDLCIRCHAPIGWLGGRSTPGDGSLLTEEDLESVSCDVCHRMVPTPNGPQLIGSGQYTIAPETTKRARRGAAPIGGHLVSRSDFQASSELCGTCHSLFNPREIAHDKDGNPLGIAYYEQRTYEEWADSAFPARGTTCIECHMKKVRGRAARQGELEYGDLRLHAIVGGNDFAPRAVDLVDPTFPLDQELPALLALIDETLRSAATLEVISTAPSPLVVRGGDELSIGIRLTNKTGHKLPTGYPEGRRVYLEVSMAMPGTATRAISGAWDAASGTIAPDAQLRTYETAHGRVEAGASARTHHLLQMNQILTDTRLPPEGFQPRAPDMIPAGRDYGPGPTYRHYDEHRYVITAPDVAKTVTATVTIRARYQVTDGEVVGFLVEQAGRESIESRNLAAAWAAFGRDPPRIMAEVRVLVVIKERGEIPDHLDEGVDPVDVGGGCSCGTQRAGAGSVEDGAGGPGGPSFELLLAFLALMLARVHGSSARPGALFPGSRAIEAGGRAWNR